MALMFATSCTVERNPRGLMLPVEAENISDVENYFNGVMMAFRGSFFGSPFVGMEVQNEYFNAGYGFGNHYGDFHRYEFNSGADEIGGYWYGQYVAINYANMFLTMTAQFEEKELWTSETEKATYEYYKGVCYFIRAHAYSHLMRTYGDLDPSVEKGGVPIITEVYNAEALMEKPERSTVTDVYTYVDADIQRAKDLLENATLPSNRVAGEYPDIAVVYALEARSMFDRELYPQAAAAAEKAITLSGKQLVTSTALLEAEWYNDAGNESILQFFASKEEATGTISAYTYFNSSKGTYAPKYIPTETLMNLYGGNDIRFRWFAMPDIELQERSTNTLPLLWKFTGNPELNGASKSAGIMKLKAYRLAEMYLVAAESYYHAGQTGEAKTKLNALQTARKTTISDATPSFIQAEWTKEMVGEGQILANKKRWKNHVSEGWTVAFSNREPQNIDFVETAPGFLDLNVDNTGNGKYFIWAIPNWDMLANGNLKGQQNRGW